MANLITLSRLLLLATVVATIYALPDPWQRLTLLLIPLMFATDALDGFVARRLNQATSFGALFDIASDRVVELVMWAVFVERGVAPVWVLALFLVRGIITDAIRSRVRTMHSVGPLSVAATKPGRWLVAGRVVRTGYAGLKGLTFCWLAMLVANLDVVDPATMESVANILICTTAFVCIARAVPVVGHYASVGLNGRV